jgi:predicted aminopeptidase
MSAARLAPRVPGRSRALLSALALLVSPGCFQARYLGQAAQGQLEILREARPIPDVVRAHEVPPRVERLLRSVPSVMRFARTEGLRPTSSYRRYADLHRPAAVWVVQACAPLAFDVKRWRFPFVGTIPYLGFFDERAARRYAATLAEEGLDVDVRGASAFSTLGWFSDPILSTMFGRGDDALGDLANIVFHESTHATLYVEDQSAFDESLASFVADRLTTRWLAAAVGADAAEARAWVTAQAREREAMELLHRAWGELDALYRSSADGPRKRSEKARILGELQGRLHGARPLNNAVLADYKTYDTGAAAFERLLEACGGSTARFMGTLGTLRPSDFRGPQRQEFDDVIAPLVQARCPQTRGELVDRGAVTVLYAPGLPGM